MNTLKKTAFSVLAVCCVAGTVRATPSTTYWTPATTDIQPYRTVHVGIDNYYTVFRKGADKGSFPTDLGLTVGVLPFEKLQAEVGADLMEPTDDPWYLNAKIGTPEGALFKDSPALNVGVFNVGTRKDVTNQDVFFVLAGKTIPVLGRLFGGYYIGNDKVLVNGDGDADNKGFMVGFDHGFWQVKDKAGDEYNRVVVAGDWASGKNAIGGGGVGVYYYFTKNIALLAGPVFFNDEAINGQWKWTTQLDINIPF